VEGVALDGMVTRMLAISPFTYRVAADAGERDTAYRLRGRAVVERGWCTVDELPDGREHDHYDDRAIHVIGWDGDVPMSTGRVVLPPGLPTEDACGIVVEPAGEVVDVGRMCVAQTHQSLEHAAFLGLMCRLYLEMREQGFSTACGMMSAPARLLVRQLGLSLEPLGPARTYWNEARTPVRFSLLAGLAHSQGASTSAVLAPPNPNEFDNT
jgi:hypothetical protein